MNDAPLRWDIADNMVFCTMLHKMGGPLSIGLLLRYPVDALVIGPDWAWPLDREHPKGALPAPNYAGLGPVSWLFQGMELVDGWPRPANIQNPIVHWDIRALASNRVELYRTLNGELSRWLLEGLRWRRAQDYTARINGPFLVCDNGRAVVAERDGQWCVIPLDGNRHVQPIVARSLDEPLLVVQDKVAKTEYLVQGVEVFAPDGRRVHTLPTARDDTERFELVSKFVVAQRPKGEPSPANRTGPESE